MVLSDEDRVLVQEATRRKGPLGSLFAEQIEAIYDPELYRLWQCGRRAGKTTAAMAEFFVDGAKHDDEREYAYIALTASSAKGIVWKILRGIDREFEIGARFRESERRVELPNGCALNLFGADRPDWMDRLYGRSFGKVWIDEAAFYSVDMEYLIDDVLEPTVTDLEGSITLMSKPGHLKRGFFYEAAHGKIPGWSVKKWDFRQNPHMRPQVERRMKLRQAKDKEYLSRPKVRRNWFNEWHQETGLLVYRFLDHMKLLEFEPGAGERYVIGVDFGFDDATAFSVVAWSEDRPEIVEVESYRESGMAPGEIARRIEMYCRFFPGADVVGDPENKYLIKQLRSRYSIPIRTAAKDDKRHWIEQWNEDAADGKIKIVKPESSPHVEEMVDLTWREKGDKQIEDPVLPNDCCDAHLMAYRHCYAWRYEPREPAPQYGTDAYWQAEEMRIEERLEEEFEDRHGETF